jgi:molybdenum cofactor biosynthesis protein B
LSKTSINHKKSAPCQLNFAVFICSTSRYNKKTRRKRDISGNFIQESLKNAGHMVVLKEIIADNKSLIINALEKMMNLPTIDAVIFSGGTGINSSDITIETIAPFLEKTLPGFGEIFRKLSFDEIGSAAVLSRAIAGVLGKKIIYCIPGSPNAAKIAVEKLILNETAHIVKHIRDR